MRAATHPPRVSAPAPASHDPRNHERISLESASIAVQVHTAPTFAGRASFAAFALAAFSFIPTNDQISSHCTRFAASADARATAQPPWRLRARTAPSALTLGPGPRYGCTVNESAIRIGWIGTGI